MKGLSWKHCQEAKPYKPTLMDNYQTILDNLDEQIKLKRRIIESNQEFINKLKK